MPFSLKKYLTRYNIFVGIMLLGIFLLGFLITFLLLGLTKSSPKNILSAPNEFSKATPAPVNEVNPQKGIYNILLIGYGGTGHAGGLLADSIITAHIDTNTKKISLITIPRDLWVPGNHKINAAGVSVGFQNVGAELQNVTGLPINYYVAVDFGSFVKLIDALGGISVEVPNTFSDDFYPVNGLENETCGKTGDEINALKAKYSGFELEKQFACRYEKLHFDKGPANLDGATALKFVRSRHGDSDFGRSLRQLAVLRGVFTKLLSFQAAGKTDDIINSLTKLVKSDLNAGVIKSLIQIIGDPNSYKTTQLQLSTDNVLVSSKSGDGQFILIPKSGNFNFGEIKKYISEQIK